MFGGRVNVGINYNALRTYENEMEKRKMKEGVQTILYYTLLIFGDDDEDVKTHQDLAETFMEHGILCEWVIELFKMQ
jgi:hypothetical protein